MGPPQKNLEIVSLGRMIEVIVRVSQSTGAVTVVSLQDTRRHRIRTDFVIKLRQFSQSIARGIERHGLHFQLQCNVLEFKLYIPR